MAIDEDDGDPTGLRDFLKASEPAWKDKDLEAVVKKLAKVGIAGLAELLRLLQEEETGEEDGEAVAPAEHEINRLLRSAGERRFASGTLGKLRARAAGFTTSGGLRVELRNLAGELVELELAPHCRGLDLKARAAELWQVPVACQKAVVGNTVLGDSEPLVAHLPPNASALPVTVLVSLDSVARDLEDDAGPIRKVTALSVLAQLPSAGRQQALDTVAAHLDHDNEDVRRAALRAFGRLAPEGDRDTTARLVHCLTEDPNVGVRQSAAEALGDAASKGDETIVEVLMVCLTDEEATIRAAAARALERVSQDGDAKVVEALCGLLEDGDAGVRWCAVDLVSRAALGASSPLAVAAAAARLEHSEADVRRCAVLALGALAEAADEAPLAALRGRLEDDDASVRCAALEALCSTAGPDDLRVAAAAHAMLEDPEETARLGGLTVLRRRAATLGADAQGSPAQTVLAVAKRLQDPSDAVRKAAVETLRLVAEEGNVLAVTQAAACTEHQDPGVRLRAVEALSKVAQRGDQCAVSALLDLIPNARKHDGLRLKAMEALGALAEPGDARASAAAYESCLEDSSAAVRSAAWAVCERLERS